MDQEIIHPSIRSNLKVAAPATLTIQGFPGLGISGAVLLDQDASSSVVAGTFHPHTTKLEINGGAFVGQVAVPDVNCLLKIAVAPCDGDRRVPLHFHFELLACEELKK